MYPTWSAAIDKAPNTPYHKLNVHKNTTYYNETIDPAAAATAAAARASKPSPQRVRDQPSQTALVLSPREQQHPRPK